MNHRVRKYTPIYLSPQHYKVREEGVAPLGTNWKAYLKKEVEDRYKKIKEVKDSECTMSPVKSTVTLCSQMDNTKTRS
jgi:hypothetical protein